MATLIASSAPPTTMTPPTIPVASPVATVPPTDASSTTTPETKPECAVCCETFSTNVRSHYRHVSCPACDYGVCYKCVRTYLLNLEAAPQCMNCQNLWDEEFQHMVLSNALCQKLRDSAIVRMVDREKALLPQTQIHLERKAVYEERMEAVKAIDAEHRILLVDKKVLCGKLSQVNLRYRIAQEHVRHANMDVEGLDVYNVVDEVASLKTEQQVIIVEKKELYKKIANVERRRDAALASAYDVEQMLNEDRRDPLRIHEQPIPPIQTVAFAQATKMLENVDMQTDMYISQLQPLLNWQEDQNNHYNHYNHWALAWDANNEDVQAYMQDVGIPGHEQTNMLQNGFLQTYVQLYGPQVLEYQRNLQDIAAQIADVRTTYVHTSYAPQIHIVVTRISEKITNALTTIEQSIYVNANAATNVENTATISNINASTTTNVLPDNSDMTNVTPTNTTANVPPTNASTGPTEPSPSLSSSAPQPLPPPEPHAGRGCEQDGCRGFLNRQGKCGVCNTWVCAKCHKVKAAHHDPDHECNEDDVKTVALLTKETKPCPGCGIHTQRISGCSHMWCPQCHTHFSWTTGQPMGNGTAHNPHMYEWDMQQLLQGGGGGGYGAAPNRTNVELPCNGPLEYRHQRHVLETLHHRIDLNRTLPGESWTVISKLSESMRFCGHLLHTVQWLRGKVRKCEQRKFDLRIRYLTNDLTPEKWCSQLKRIDKTEKRSTSQRLALSVYTTASSDLFRTAYQCTTLDELQTRALQPLDKLTDYVNQQLDVIDKRHQFKGTPVRIVERAVQGRWVMEYRR